MPDTTRQQLVAATVALPAVASHEAAAEIHGMSGVQQDLAVVTVPTRSTNRFAGVIVHQSTDLIPEDSDEIGGIPVTNPPRTILDLAAVLTVKRLEHVLDHAMAAQIVSYESLAKVLQRVARRGKPGTARLRSILSDRGPGYVAPESELERILFQTLEDAGLPAPERQYPMPWRDHRDGRVDLAYPAHRLIIEADGRRWHTLAAAFETDRRRDNLAQLAGWRVLRFTWHQLTEEPQLVSSMVRSALDASEDAV